jgi:hypothetical protein
MASGYYLSETTTRELRPGSPETIPVAATFPLTAFASSCDEDYTLCLVLIEATPQQLQAIDDPRVLPLPRGNYGRRINRVAPARIAAYQSWLDAHGIAVTITDHDTIRDVLVALGRALNNQFDIKSLRLRGVIGARDSASPARR